MNDPLTLSPTWGGRGLAFLRFLLFAVLVVGLVLGAQWLSPLIMGPRPPGPASLPDLLRMEATFTACSVLANLILVAVWRQPLSMIGLGGQNRLRYLGLGVVVGALSMSGLMGALYLLGVVQFGGVVLSPPAIVGYGLSYVAMFAMAAVAEQGVMRSYALTQLSQAISFWPAALIMAALFGLMHTGNGGESLFGAAMAGLFGLIMAWSFKRTGALWFAFGVHATWDFMETFTFGVPNSGLTSPGALTHAVLSGPVNLTGGSAGPEGSWVAVAALGAIALVVSRLKAQPAG